jgi:hypothetical protein
MKGDEVQLQSPGDLARNVEPVGPLCIQVYFLSEDDIGFCLSDEFQNSLQLRATADLPIYAALR